MAATITDVDGAVSIGVNFTTKKALNVTIPEDRITMAKRVAYTFGTGALKGNEVWHDRRVISSSSSDNLDLAAILTNAYGETVTFATVKAIVVFNRTDETTTSPSHTATTAIITVGGSAGAEFLGPFDAAGDGIKVGTGGSFAITDALTGWDVTGTSADILEIKNNDGANQALYDIFIIGDSA